MLSSGSIRSTRPRRALAAGALCACLAAAGCASDPADAIDHSGHGSVPTPVVTPPAVTATTATSGPISSVPAPATTPAPGAVGPTVSAAPTTTAAPNIYSRTLLGMMSPAVLGVPEMVYVPGNDDGMVSVIDPATMKVVKRYHVGSLAQHVVADWDMKTLWATASAANRLVPIDPMTGEATGPGYRIDAPYNLYFTPDGRKAVVMAERLNRIDFYDRSSLPWTLLFSTETKRSVGCDGPNHADWSLDLSWFLVTCEFSGKIIKVSTEDGTILNDLLLVEGGMPQDLRTMPDGKKFYVADMASGVVFVLDETGTKVTGHIDTGVGPHGIYPSRDGTKVYITNRGRLHHDTKRPSRPGEGSVSVVDWTTDQVLETWPMPEGGSPDMGGVSADGRTLWLSGRYDDEVYAFDTTTGRIKATIPVPGGPHGLNVFPQPGVYSLGHTGNYR